jgi:hypothetical protein
MKYLFLVLLFCISIVYGQEAKLTVSIEGKIKNARSFSFDEFKRMPSVTIDSLQLYNHLMETRSKLRAIKGVLLKEVLKDIVFDVESPKLLSEFYIVCTAPDNYKVVFSWNEIFNSAAGDKIMIATEYDGASATVNKDGLLLVTPTDRATGRRHVRELSRIIIQRVN